MKKALFLLVLFVLLIAITPLALQTVTTQIKKDLLSSPSQESDFPPTITYVPSGKEEASLFVPFWTIDSEPLHADAYKRLIYFGVAADTSGINTNESGYKMLRRFISLVPDGRETHLTIRMLDTNVNAKMLKDVMLQEQIIQDAVTIAGAHGFSGIILDFELLALPLDRVVSQISTFVSHFAKQAKIRDLRFGIAVYADTFYRVRPFDMKTIAESVDEVLIMAYDFHKSYGSTPGPNFPFSGSEQYGYDFQQMTSDFQAFVPSEKMTVIFGMFGYDWVVDDKGKATESGRPVTLYQATTLSEKPEVIEKRDPLSGEMIQTYKDSDGKNHVVWYEDNESMEKKKAFLKSRGIGSFSFWANSYF